MPVHQEKTSSDLAGLIDRESEVKDEIDTVQYKTYGFENTVESVIKPDNEKGKGEDDEKKKDDLPNVGFFSLFRHASGSDRVLIALGTIVAISSGASMPALMIIFGKVIDKLIVFDHVRRNVTNETMTTEEFLHESSALCLYFALCGFALLLCNYIMVTTFSLTAANQAFKIRCLFMSSILKQEIGWYDTNETGDFASRITGDLQRVQDGMADKVAICITFMSSTVLCIVSGMYYNWKLSLVILSIAPVSTLATAIMTKIQASVTREEMEAYGKAGAVAEEVLSSIRTVFAFGGERKEIQRYDNCLTPARKKGIKRGLLTGLGAGLHWICIFGGYALAFWYGFKLIVEGIGQENPELTGGTLITVFFNIMSASMYVGQTAPYFEAFALATGAAAKVYNIIERVPTIDSSSDEGGKPNSLSGHINLNNVHFNYPSRPTVSILKGVSLDVQPGETVALVGPSGCGKSTIVQLILRFYDTEAGEVALDGINVKDLNVGWLRDHIGLVGQEPVLFSTTIAENIRYGKRNATPEEIENAAKVANVHDFVDALPLKYETLVGERGTQLSGGQKQRIAIARALIKNPKILLLDEATSALDTESEAVVQAALDEARLGRTTVVVAHRLSTIKTADKIIVLSDGEVKEVGTHEELMKTKGVYYQLVITQTREEEEDVEDDDEDIEEDLVTRERGLSATSAGSLGSGDGILPEAGSRSLSFAGKRYGRQGSSVSGYGRRTSTIGGYEHQISSVSGEKDAVTLNEEDSEDVDTTSSSRIWRVVAPEWPYILIGGLSAVLMGLHFPGFGILFGEVLGTLALDPTLIEDQVAIYCLIFVGMAITSCVFSFLQIFMFTVVGEKLTSNLRKMVFTTIISQDMEFFDHPKNSVGSLCSRLTSDASTVQGITGSRISTILQAASVFIASMCIAFWFNYIIGLVLVAFIPFIMLGTYSESRVVTGQQISETTSTEAASKIAIEAIENIRTVASLHQEETFYTNFCTELMGPHKKSRLIAHVRGIMYGYAQALTVFARAATMYTGIRLIASEDLEYSQFLKIMEGVLIGIQIVGRSFAFAPDYYKAKVAAARIFKLLDLKPKIDASSSDGKVLNGIRGCVSFQKVHFNYPSRPNVRVLKGLDLEIEPGQTVALVGSSGCGKSTCVQLIERFYDTTYGTVMLDQENVQEMNVSNLRSHIGLVSQEPILFSYSIAENIAYGDNSRKVQMSEIIEAARQANIHNFITSLPQGYDTPVGDKGTQLSGGQKQRVAIARALLRNPKLLLLDEATSALDAESEKIVQDALDRARSGRTCLIIAHRLTTVQNADVIMVIHKGKIVEKGTHQELINKKGFYYKLHNIQSGMQ